MLSEFFDARSKDILVLLRPTGVFDEFILCNFFLLLLRFDVSIAVSVFVLIFEFLLSWLDVFVSFRKIEERVTNGY